LSWTFNLSTPTVKLNFAFIGVSVVIPGLVVILANLVRRRSGLSTSTGGDLVLAGLVANFGIWGLTDLTVPFGLDEVTFQVASIIVALLGVFLFFETIRLQKIRDEHACSAWANKNKPKRSTATFSPSQPVPRAQEWATWIGVHVFLTLHVATYLRI
jgi:hypothetical protein